ncbi:MAG: hypothetical protein AAFZ15_08400 [Bacteroidota bacterium]
MDAIIKTWNKIYEGHQLLAITGALTGVLFFFSTAIMAVDDRMLMGVNVWIKPMKFALSGMIYNWTIALLLPLYTISKRQRHNLGNILAISMSVELLIIFIQASRGELSHYNTSTPLNGILFGIMGLGIAIISLISIYLCIISFKQKLNTEPAIAWSIRFAWLAVVLSFYGGQMMISNMGHNVGVPDGGAGLPVVNWSTEGGDLRAMHFLGLHAIQILPLLTLLVGKIKYFEKNNRLMYFTIFAAVVYFSIIIFTWWQAINGLPFYNAMESP